MTSSQRVNVYFSVLFLACLQNTDGIGALRHCLTIDNTSMCTLMYFEVSKHLQKRLDCYSFAAITKK